MTIMDLMKGERFVSNFVLGLGAVAGFFARAGFDPEGSLIGSAILALNLDPNYTFMFGIILIIVVYSATAWQLRNAFHVGGLIGLIAVTLGMLGAFFLPEPVGVILFAAALLLGFISPYTAD